VKTCAGVWPGACTSCAGVVAGLLVPAALCVLCMCALCKRLGTYLKPPLGYALRQVRRCVIFIYDEYMCMLAQARCWSNVRALTHKRFHVNFQLHIHGQSMSSACACSCSAECATPAAGARIYPVVCAYVLRECLGARLRRVLRGSTHVQLDELCTGNRLCVVRAHSTASYGPEPAYTYIRV
jgi:hypothetical protein